MLSAGNTQPNNVNSTVNNVTKLFVQSVYPLKDIWDINMLKFSKLLKAKQKF